MPGGNSADGNLITDGTTSTLNVTFDRPMQMSTFTPSQVLQIMGPAGSISGPQYFPSTSSTGQIIPAATSSTSPGTLDSTLTVPSYDGTFTIANITVELNAAFSPDSDLTAVLIAPNGTQVTLFSDVGGSGSNFINTVFDDSAENSITTGTAPFTGTYQPDRYALDPGRPDGRHPEPAGSSLWVPGVWTLQLTNTATGATGMLDNWSLNITPLITVTPVSPVDGSRDHVPDRLPAPAAQRHLHDPARPRHPRHVRRRARYQPERGPGGAAGPGSEQPDDHRSVHRDRPAQADSRADRDDSEQVSSTITVPDNFVDPGRHDGCGDQRHAGPDQPDLSQRPRSDGDAVPYDLTAPSSQVAVPLFSGVGSGTTTANFNNTVFDDNAATPIQNGSAPFFATFNPQQSLATAFARPGCAPGDLDAGHHERLDDGQRQPARSPAGR